MQKNWRECDSCGIKMAAYEPRRKVGDSFLCPDCAKKAKVEMTARKKTATWSQARHPRPLIHTPGRKPSRPLQTGDSLLWEDGSTDPIVGHSESLLMTPSGIKHRGPIEGDYSNTIFGIDADDKADMDNIGSPEEVEFLRTNPTGPSKYSVRKVAHDSGDGMSIYHCFSGETRYLTEEGVKTLAETVGTVQRVMTGGDDRHGGQWVDAIIHEFGEQALLSVTVRRNRQTKVIRATADHRWLVHDGHGGPSRLVVTSALKPGARLSHLRLPRFEGEQDRDGIRMGFVFGDGTIQRGVNNTYGLVTLFGGKMDLAKYFDEVATSEPTQVITPNGVKGLRYSSGMKGYTKELPPLTAPREYLLGWLMGYFAADGSVSSKQGQASITCVSLETLLHVRDVATLLGIGTYAPTSRMVKGFGDSPSVLHQMGFAAADLGESFFLRDDQRAAGRAQHHDRFGWTVVSVEDHGEIENVYCPRVPGTETFVLEDNIHTGNCPFCGSGQVIARSDGTVECQFCHNAFTVQVQPQYPAFPQTIDGMPVQVPGMPGQIGGPSSPMDPGMLGPDGEMPGEEEGPAEGAEDAEEAPPGEEDEGGDDAPPWAKKSYRTPAGHVLPGDEFIRHVAIHTSSDRLLTARAIRETRRP